MMTLVGEILMVAALLSGAFFTLVGSIGLMKLDTPMKRLHAPTKASTLGVGSFLAASMIYSWLQGEPTFSDLLIMAFLFVTAPISANFIAKVHLHDKCVDPTPPPPGDRTWATFSEPTSDAQLSQDV